MTRTTLPTSRIVTQDWNQDFHWLNGHYYPNGFYASVGWKGHNGIDYGCQEGDPVEAVCDGIIEYVGPGNNHPLLTGGGNAILLRNDTLGVRFEYLHLSRFEVTEGQRVRVGQVIARSGNTGISSAPHLHIGAIPVRRVDVANGYRGRVDPTPYLYGPMNPDYASSAAVGPQGTTITPLEEDDMFTQADRDEIARVKQLLLSFQAAITDPVTGYVGHAALAILRSGSGTQYVKGPEETTIYEYEDGKLRGLNLDEWKIAHGAGNRPVVLPQADIDKMKEKS